ANLEGIRETDLLRLYEGALETLFIPFRKKPAENEPREKPESTAANRPPRRNTTFTRTPDRHSLDFKKRVRDLKFGVDKQIAEAKEENETKESEDEQKKRLPSPNSSLANTPSTVSEKDLDQEEFPAAKYYPMSYRFAAGLEMRSVYSE